MIYVRQQDNNISFQYIVVPLLVDKFGILKKPNRIQGGASGTWASLIRFKFPESQDNFPILIPEQK